MSNANHQSVPSPRASWSRIARRIRVPLGFVFAFVFVWLARPTLHSLLIGMAIAIPGLIVRALASGHVKKDEQLTTTGPYAYIRNPLYFGSILLGIGFAFASRSWVIGVLLVLMFLAIYIPVIRSEENFLRQAFPEFSEYARYVPRFFPRLTPYARGGAFSWGLYRKHREYQAGLGVLGLLAILIAKLMW